jgi:hypothetical protein
MIDEDKHVLVGYPTRMDAYVSKTVVEVVSLRDQLAMSALMGSLSSGSNGTAKEIAEWAYEVADAMMEKRQ